MSKFFKNQRLTASVLIALAYTQLVVPINESLAFHLPLTQSRQITVSYLYKLLFFVLLVCSIHFALNFVSQLKSNGHYRLWLKISSIYFLINIPLFILIYPGFWVWDELYVLNSAQNYSLEAWQHIFTNIYHTFCLYIIPSGVGVVLVQLAIISVIVGYVVSKSLGIWRYKRFGWFLIVPFLFIPVLVNNLYPLRLTIYGYLELFLLFNLLLVLTGKYISEHKYVDYLGITLLATVLAFWRPEGSIYLVTIPLYAWKMGFLHPRKWGLPDSRTRIQFAIIVTAPLLFIATASYVTTKTTDPKYQLPPTLGALSIILSNANEGEMRKMSDKLNDINKVIDVQQLKDNAAYNDVPVIFWKGPKPGYETKLSGYNKAFLAIALENPRDFLMAKLQTFRATNSLDIAYPPHIGNGIRFAATNDAEFSWLFSSFYANNYLSRPWNNTLKLNTTRALLGLGSKNRLSEPYAALTWTVIPSLIVLTIGLIYSFGKKKIGYSIILLLIFARAFFIFISAPAGFFMYYFPTYLTVNFFICFILCSYYYNRLHPPSKRA